MFLIVTFQKARFFSAGGRHGRDRKSARQIEYSYHMEVRTLNARRMFREKIQSYRWSRGKQKQVIHSPYGPDRQSGVKVRVRDAKVVVFAKEYTKRP